MSFISVEISIFSSWWKGLPFTILVWFVIGLGFIMGWSFDLVVQSVSDERCCLGLAKLKYVIGNYLCEFPAVEPLMFDIY